MNCIFIESPPQVAEGFFLNIRQLKLLLRANAGKLFVVNCETKPEV